MLGDTPCLISLRLLRLRVIDIQSFQSERFQTKSDKMALSLPKGISGGMKGCVDLSLRI